MYIFIVWMMKQKKFWVFRGNSLPHAGLPPNAIAFGELAVYLHHLLIEVLEALRHAAKSIRLLLSIDDFTVGHKTAISFPGLRREPRS